MDGAVPRSSELIAASGFPAESAAEIDALLEDRAKLRELVQYSLWDLGPGATFEDAEDALQDFCARHRQKIIDTYKPGAQPPTAYFRLCLQRFCWKRGERLRRERRNVDPLVIDLTDERQGSDPLRKILSEADQREREARESRLQEAIGHLPIEGQRLLKLYYEEGLPIREIATQHLHISEPATKVRLFRLRDRIAHFMEGES